MSDSLFRPDVKVGNVYFCLYISGSEITDFCQQDTGKGINENVLLDHEGGQADGDGHD